MRAIESGASLWVKESLTQRSPSAHRFRFVVSAAKRDTARIKEVLFDPPSGLMLADRYGCACLPSLKQQFRFR